MEGQSPAELGEKKRAFGWPEGSVRACLALTLVIGALGLGVLAVFYDAAREPFTALMGLAGYAVRDYSAGSEQRK